MSPVATHCGKHGRIVLQGERCPECAMEGASMRSRRRRENRNRDLGRNSEHWRRISRIRRRRAGDRCEIRLPGCTDIATTCDLIGGGDHARARLADTRAACRACHGKVDGGRR
jgi:hypothetical protein